MKLTKFKLKQIIKEELKSVLYETWPADAASGTGADTPEKESWRTGIKFEPTKYQPPEPGPVETRIQQLEDLVARLLNKISPGPMTPEAAEEIRASATPFNEKKEHPGDCDDVHPNKSHEMWEETSWQMPPFMTL